MAFEYKMLVLMTLFFVFAWLPASIAKWKSFGEKWLGSSRNPVIGKELLPWGALGFFVGLSANIYLLTKVF